MYDTFLWPHPAQLAYARNMPPECPHVGGKRFERAANNKRLECCHRRHAQFVTTSNGKGQAMPLHARRIGMQHHIGCGIIWVDSLRLNRRDRAKSEIGHREPTCE